jgi:CMP-N-acetylneuraminic acid synthetase
MSNSISALIPAREGSLRVPNKNIRELNGHPTIAYTIQSAIDSKIFDSIIVASNSELVCKIAYHYGATQVIKRTEEDSTSTSLDIEWLKNLYSAGKLTTDLFSILRPTSPLRSVHLINECVDTFLNSNADSLRTITRVSEHPGKMWRTTSEGIISPYLIQPECSPATHAMQYQSLEELYVQTSVFEIAKTSVIKDTNSREGNTVLGYVTYGIDSHSIDSEEDFDYLKFLVNNNLALLPIIKKTPIKINL